MKKALWIVLTVIIVLSIVQMSSFAETNYSYQTDIKSLVTAKGCGDCHFFMSAYNTMTTQVIGGKKLINTAAPDSSLPTEASAPAPRTPRKRRHGMATKRPHCVVISASEMPPAMKRGSLVPNKVTILKVVIMPVTVPRSPRSGATAAHSATNPSRA